MKRKTNAQHHHNSQTLERSQGSLVNLNFQTQVRKKNLECFVFSVDTDVV